MALSISQSRIKHNQTKELVNNNHYNLKVDIISVFCFFSKVGILKVFATGPV